jgi:ABC-type multidrug transport system fused ATPase/permease subunit
MNKNKKDSMDETESNNNGKFTAQPNETLNMSAVDAPGASIDPKQEEINRANEENINTNVQEQHGDEEQKVVESSEVQIKDPREPKLKFGPIYMFKIIGWELIWLIPAIICAGATGVAPLLFFEVLGGLFSSFSTSTGSTLTSQTNQAALYIFIIALVAMVLQFISHFIFNFMAQRIGNKIKSEYFSSVTRQEIGFFDIKKAGSIANTLSDDASKVTDAFSVNLQDLFQYGTQFVVAIILALIANYAMALLEMIAIPLMLITFGVAGRVLDILGRKQGRLLGDSVSTANEVISSMRTVRSMAGEEREIKRYVKDLKKIRKIYLINSAFKGVAFGAVLFFIWGAIALAFFFGGKLVYWGQLNVGNFIKVYGLVLLAIIALMQVFNVIPEIIKAISSTVLLLQVIKREPAIRFKGGKTLDKIEGRISFRNVTFRYPSRPKVEVLKDFSLEIEPGQSVAIVGPSGSGKSTIVHLLEKWYEAEAGEILLDGVDIKEIDPMWLHRYVGIVQQEPTLFGTTIKRNITYAIDTYNLAIKQEARKKNKRISDEELEKMLIPVTDDIVQKAAEAANCHEFIMTLPDKYDTLVGERGVSVSGGQKQRIAIARAILQNPKILLLDEATSALHTKSEALVQDALNKLMVGRTTIVIAHRLTTIQDCDKIVVLKAGKVVEMGKHDELLEKRGAYYKLAQKQMKLGVINGSSSDLTSSGSETDLDKINSDDEHDIHVSDNDHLINTESYTLLESPSTSNTRERSLENHQERKINEGEGMIEEIQQHLEQPADVNVEKEVKKGKQSRKSRLRRRHEEHKKRRKELEQFQNEEDVADPHEPKIRTSVGILPYLGPEWIFIAIGTLGACIVGTVPIAFYIIFGRVINALIPNRLPDGTIVPFPPGYNISTIVSAYAGYTAIVAGGGAIGQFINMYFFSLANDRVGIRIKAAYFKSIVNQEIGFFDIKKSGKILNVISEDIGTLQNGYTSRLSVFIQNMFQCILGVIFAIITSWDTALIALAGVLFLCFMVGLFTLGTSRANTKIGHLSASTLSTATEVIGSIRTVRSLGGEEREQTRFNNDLSAIQSVAIIKAFFRGITQMTIQFIILADAAFVFYYGGQKVANGSLPPGNLLQVFGFVLFSVIGLSLALSEVSTLAKASSAAKEVLRVLKRKPQIPLKGGKKLDKISGNVIFENVSFNYPSRPNVTVLKNFNLEIKEGQHVALVGESGCGKSTIAGLVERFYDPNEGSVKIDGLDLKEADCNWLHQNIAIVTQEPTLFATTIKNNITYSVGDKQVPEEKIIECAKAANCHDFISNLPNGYDTMIGERGVSMSGGQKQRIAIARAMLMDSSLLILDEATSALDTESEALVQEALDRLMKGRTSIVIAHRLSTIKDCDVIVAMKNGQVMEKGNYEELIQKKGMFYKLAKKQMEFGKHNPGISSSVNISEKD